MFTQNYINYRRNMFFASIRDAVQGIEPLELTKYDGTKYKMYDKYLHYSDIGYALTNASIGNLDPTYGGGSGVRYGSGSTPATKDDIKLESMYTSGLSVIGKAVTTAVEGDGVYSVVAIYSVKNTGNDTKTIRECGVFCGITYSSSNNENDTLMERTVFDEPVVIEPGQTKQITYKITFHH